MLYANNGGEFIGLFIYAGWLMLKRKKLWLSAKEMFAWRPFEYGWAKH